jgi:signal peptide peptidase SppA
MTRRDEALRLFGAKPLLIEPTKLDSAFGARRLYTIQDGVAIIDIAGVLANEPSLFDAILFGATAYGQILDEVEQAVSDPEVRGILLRVNSPGGDSENAFETAAALAELARQKPIWAVADNSMFSAAYLLAMSASRIYVPEFTGGVGSIGVYAEHLDWSDFNRKLGVKVTYIAEGEGKTDGNPNESLSDSARATLETEVARLYGLFVAAVASRRGMREEATRAMGAALKYGPDAVSAGLADRTGTFRNALADLAAFVKPTSIPQGGKRIMTEETVRADAPEPAIDLEAIRAEARKQGYGEAREIADLCALAGMPAKATALLARGATPAEARQFLIEARAAEDAAEIRSHVMPDTGTSAKPPLENNPVVKAVERLAKGGVN